MYQQSISTRVVKSDKMSLDLVDSVNRGQARIAAVFPSKSPGIKTPLKETSIVPNDFRRICRIDLKTSGRSKINIFGKNNEFLKTLSSVLLSDVIQQNMMGVSQIICQKCQREVLQFLRVLGQLEKFWEKCNKALRIQLVE